MSTRPKIIFIKAAREVWGIWIWEYITCGFTATLDKMDQRIGCTFSYTVT